MKLRDKISILTGAGRGIGRSIALAFAEEGSNLVLVARSRDPLENVAQEIRNRDSNALPVTCDVASAQDVQDLAKAVEDEFGQHHSLGDRKNCD